MTHNFKIGDRIVARRDACFSWNENVKEGDEFTIVNQSDLNGMDALGLNAHYYFEKKESNYGRHALPKNFGIANPEFKDIGVMHLFEYDTLKFVAWNKSIEVNRNNVVKHRSPVAEHGLAGKAHAARQVILTSSGWMRSVNINRGRSDYVAWENILP